MNRLDRKVSGFARALASARFFITVLATGIALPAFAQPSGTWQLTGSLNIPRTAHTATLLSGGEVLVVGGKDSSGNILITAELYNPGTGRWSTTGTLATPRWAHTATLLQNGKVLVAGGFDSQTVYESTATAELYDPATGKWTTTGNMTVARARAGAALLPNGEVLVAGGVNTDGTSGNSSELYNPSTGKWTDTGNMPVAESAPATTLLSGQVLIAGGDFGEVYTFSTGQWTETPKLYYQGSTGTTATLLANGNVVIFGNHLVSYTSQFYSPVSNTWSRTLGQSGLGITSGPLVTLANGNVLLAGDVIVYSGRASATANVGLYNSSTNSWAPTGKLKQAVLGRTATRLQNGQVLAVAGSDAELYTP